MDRILVFLVEMWAMAAVAMMLAASVIFSF